MADGSEKVSESSSQFKEEGAQDDVKHLKRKLEGWRELILPIHSVLIWEKPFFPGIIAGACTLVFMLIWYLDLSVLTTLSIIGLFGSLLDYTVPLISSNLFDPNQWNGTQEKDFEAICKSLVCTKYCALDAWNSLGQMKQNKPKVYFVTILSTLVLLAWIGNVFDNLFLTYLIVVFLVLLPGMKRNGTVKRFVTQAVLIIKDKMGKNRKIE